MKMETILFNCLIKLLSNDQDTYNHSLRLGSMAKIMSKHLEFDEEQKNKLIIGCYLHDYGKICIPYNILHKKAALSSKEWEIMKHHPIIGERLLKSEGIMDEEIIDVVKYHHERVDGKGYPYGLSGSEIPIYARICSIIDAYDSMVSDRVYRKGLTPTQANEELKKQSGIQFDDFYVNEFLYISLNVQKKKEKMLFLKG